MKYETSTWEFVINFFLEIIMLMCDSRQANTSHPQTRMID